MIFGSDTLGCEMKNRSNQQPGRRAFFGVAIGFASALVPGRTLGFDRSDASDFKIPEKGTPEYRKMVQSCAIQYCQGDKRLATELMSELFS